jgi:hypothetical protein
MNFLKLPHLRKVTVTTATWQYWNTGPNTMRCVGPRMHIINVHFHCGLFTMEPTAVDIVISHGLTAYGKGAGCGHNPRVWAHRVSIKVWALHRELNLPAVRGHGLRHFYLLSNIDLKNRNFKKVDLKNFIQVSGSYWWSKASANSLCWHTFFHYNVPSIRFLLQIRM